VSLAAAICTACTVTDEKPKTQAQPAGVEVPGVGFLVGGRKSNDPMPTPTNTGAEPVISDWFFVGTNEAFTLNVVVNSELSLEAVHVQIDGQHYVVDASPEYAWTGSVDACEMITSQQGYSCTQACLDACACVTCDDSVIRDAIHGSCAGECSIGVQQGTVGPGHEPYTSEVAFADIVYNGTVINNTPVDGVLASFPGCEASKCAAAANKERGPQMVWFGFQGADFQGSIDALDGGSLIAGAHQAQDGSPVIYSQSSSMQGASLSSSCSGGYGIGGSTTGACCPSGSTC